MQEGAALYLDEINVAEPAVLIRLDEALDFRRELNNDGNRIRASEGWWVCSSINPLDRFHSGTHELPGQLLSRFPVRARALDYSGAEVDVDSYLLERKGDAKGRFFIDEKQISPHTNIAILLDMSSSISTLEEQYLKSIVIIGEALSYFRMNFSIFVFNQGNFHVVKMCREPWSNGIKEKLASLENKGGTPLAEALLLTQYYSNLENCRKIVVITDGEPNDMRKSSRCHQKS